MIQTASDAAAGIEEARAFKALKPQSPFASLRSWQASRTFIGCLWVFVGCSKFRFGFNIGVLVGRSS